MDNDAHVIRLNLFSVCMFLDIFSVSRKQVAFCVYSGNGAQPLCHFPADCLSSYFDFPFQACLPYPFPRFEHQAQLPVLARQMCSQLPKIEISTLKNSLIHFDREKKEKFSPKSLNQSEWVVVSWFQIQLFTFSVKLSAVCLRQQRIMFWWLRLRFISYLYANVCSQLMKLQRMQKNKNRF